LLISALSYQILIEIKICDYYIKYLLLLNQNFHGLTKTHSKNSSISLKYSIIFLLIDIQVSRSICKKRYHSQIYGLEFRVSGLRSTFRPINHHNSLFEYFCLISEHTLVNLVFKKNSAVFPLCSPSTPT
jgi:hypothetical protein